MTSLTRTHPPLSPSLAPGRIIHNVQALRFVAAAAIALSHMADLMITHDEGDRGFWSLPLNAGVDLFFVISGFIMLCLSHDEFGKPGAASEFLKRRILRIVPPYWFFTTLTVAAVLVAGGQLKGTTVDPAQLLTSYTFLPWPRADGRMVPILSQGWTLNYEAFFYAAFAIALLMRRGILLLASAFLLLALIHPLLPERLFMLRFWSNPIILEFLGGMALARFYLSGLRLPLAASLTGAALAALSFLATRDLDLGEYARFVKVGIPALLLAAALILAPEPQRIGTIGRLVRLGGDASYTLYLSHYAIVNAFALVWIGLGLGPGWAGVAFGATLAIAAAILFYQFAERPLTDALGRKLKLRRTSRLETVAP